MFEHHAITSRGGSAPAASRAGNLPAPAASDPSASTPAASRAGNLPAPAASDPSASTPPARRAGNLPVRAAGSPPGPPRHASRAGGQHIPGQIRWLVDLRWENGPFPQRNRPMFEHHAITSRRGSAPAASRAGNLLARVAGSAAARPKRAGRGGRDGARLAGAGAGRDGPERSALTTTVEVGRTSRPVSRILCPPRAAGDGHPSGHTVTGYLERSTRGLGRAALPVHRCTSIRAAAPRAVRPSTLLRAGFTEPPRSPGVLVRSYRTVSPLPRPSGRGGLFSVALSRGSPRVAVSNRPALWSPDFPRAGA